MIIQFSEFSKFFLFAPPFLFPFLFDYLLGFFHKICRLALTQEAQQKTTIPNAGLPSSAPAYTGYATKNHCTYI
jgi:hypothetical protein